MRNETKCIELFLTIYSRALRCMFFGELKSLCSSKSCIIRLVVCNTVFKKKKSVLLKVSTLQQVFVYLKYIQCAKTCKTCKNVHLKCFWTLFKNVHCQGPCILRPCISRPYCRYNIILKLEFDCLFFNLWQFKKLSKNIRILGQDIQNLDNEKT